MVSLPRLFGHILSMATPASLDIQRSARHHDCGTEILRRAVAELVDGSF